MARTLVRFSVLALLWAAWSGHTDPLIVGFGVVSCLSVVLITRRGRRVAAVWDRYGMGLRPIAYVPWLIWQVVLCNIAVARIIWSPKLPISPHLVRIPADQQTPPAIALYANSITLTPGTVSLDVRDGEILVHALTEEAARETAEGVMGARVTTLEGSR